MTEQDMPAQAQKVTGRIKRHRCPICGKGFTLLAGQPRPRWFPFCSERCKWVDLAGWLGGHYKIVTPLMPEASTQQDDGKEGTL
ncbi:MAG: DNA gyrase inhibitor YacG [Sedimentisphaerales bacterium]|nr:DNA gyrase inhibitor YacG [Sedimentisphaerales bacterium]